jgi:hypothetical protein
VKSCQVISGSNERRTSLGLTKEPRTHWFERKSDRGKTVTKPFRLSRLGLALSEKQIPQVVEKFESGDKREETLEPVALRVKQAL